MPSYTTEDLAAALTSYQRGEYPSIRTCSNAFNIPFSTLQNQLHSYKSTFQGYENQQLLTSTEESTLVK
jgi:hypothetical protein